MENWSIPVAEPNTPLHVFFLFMFAYLSIVFIQTKEMRAFRGNTEKKKTQVLPGHFLSICSASVAVIWETVVNTWAQCTDARSIQYRW